MISMWQLYGSPETGQLRGFARELHAKRDATASPNHRGSAARSRVLSRLTSLAITNSIPGSLAYSSRSDG